VLRNGFHANGDQSGQGYSAMTYRPFTLEGNFLAMEAVHEMLLQSWNPAAGDPEPGPIRIFPAMPDHWKDAAFTNLRAEGARRVSARRESGVTTWVRIIADRPGLVRIRDPFGGRAVSWSMPGVERVDGEYRVRLEGGGVVEGQSGGS
jgi:alpha-L-fucosidase 2